MKKNRHIIFVLLILCGISLPSSVLAVIVEPPGGGGGELPGPPILYSIPSPEFEAQLSWSPGIDATKYQIFRSNAQYGDYTKIAAITECTYTDSTVEPGLWWYYIKSKNSYGISEPSNRKWVQITHIKITSPIDGQTYTDVMHGYYPGTFGFESDKDNTIPAGWTDNSTGNCYSSVISGDATLSHKKVLCLHDVDDNYAYINTSFDAITNGRIEFWFMTSDSMVSTYILLRNSNLNLDVIEIEIGSSFWKYFNGNHSQLFDEITGSAASQTWYYIQIEIMPDAWCFEVQDDKSERLEPLSKNIPIDTLILKTRSAGHCYSYFDAIGISSDPNYGVTDNKYEGMLLDFDVTPEVSSIEYSINGQEPIPIEGSTVIPIYKSGTHTIQITTTDTQGTEWVNTCEFTLDIENVIIVLFHASDIGEKSGDISSAHYTEYGIHWIKNQLMLYEGYNKYYIFRDIREDEYNEFMEQLIKFRVGAQDTIFFYLWGHGTYDSINFDSKITVNCFSGYTYKIVSSEFRVLLDQMAYHEVSNPEGTKKIGFLAESCYAGGFVEDFERFPYLAISSSNKYEAGSTFEVQFMIVGVFSYYFWKRIFFYPLGLNNARQAYDYGCDGANTYNLKVGVSYQDPLINAIQYNYYLFEDY